MATGIYKRTEKNRHSEATKAFLKQINTGPENPNYGKKSSEKQKSIVSQTNKGNKYRLGKKWSKEEREKHRIERSARRYSDAIKKIWSDAQKKSYKENPERALKISSAKKGKLQPWMKGERNHRWILDRTLLVKSEKKHLDGRYREWMRQVKNRDYWKCQISNDNCSGRVEAHHILCWKDFPELRYEIKNGITLCHFHHPRKRSEEERFVTAFQKIVTAKMQ